MTVTASPLRLGDVGEAVRDLQERLTVAGCPVERDARFGERTEAAVRAFQQRRGLRIDGICGHETWGALIESGFTLGDRLLQLRRLMMRGDDVADLQRQLNALGFDAGREDGILGPETDAAIRRFQRDAGLAADGVCGPATIAAFVRVGGLAAGSVASVREREQLRRDSRRLDERRLFLIVDPGIQALGVEVARRLREAGADVVLDDSGAGADVLAAEANQYAGDICLTLGSGTEPGVRCAYFATQRFRSEAGFWVASRMTSALGLVFDRVEAPVGRTYRILRETRMAAVVVELFSTAEPDAASMLSPLVPALASALVEGVRRGVEEPLDIQL